VVPDLINLRILSNVIYFVGRALSKEDDISSLTTRLENYNKRVDWVYTNAGAIVESITTKLAAAQAAK
jgi:homoserine kinase type II